MAIIGLIFMVGLGLYLLWFGFRFIQTDLMFQTPEGWIGLIPFAIGCAVLWFAYVYSPISVHWN